MPMMMTKKGILSLVAIAISVIAVTFAFAITTRHASLNSDDKSVLVNEPKASTLPASFLPIPGPVRMVRFTLYDEGIHPNVARVTHGLVAIYIEDMSTHSAVA